MLNCLEKSANSGLEVLFIDVPVCVRALARVRKTDGGREGGRDGGRKRERERERERKGRRKNEIEIIK